MFVKIAQNIIKYLGYFCKKINLEQSKSAQSRNSTTPPKKNYAPHAWQRSILVWLLGRPICSSPSTRKELHAQTHWSRTWTYSSHWAHPYVTACFRIERNTSRWGRHGQTKAQRTQPFQGLDPGSPEWSRTRTDPRDRRCRSRRDRRVGPFVAGPRADPACHSSLGGEACVVRQQIRAPPGDAENEPGLEQVDEDPELARAAGQRGGDEAEWSGRDQDVKRRPSVASLDQSLWIKSNIITIFSIFISPVLLNSIFVSDIFVNIIKIIHIIIIITIIIRHSVASWEFKNTEISQISLTLNNVVIMFTC